MKTSRKLARTISGVLCLLMLLTSMPALAETYATVRGGGLNLRQTASLDAKVLGQYPTGTWVTVLEAGKEWSKVTVNGKTGYMLSKYLSGDTGCTVMYVRTNTGIGLNLRTAPDMNGAIITSFRPGTAVKVLKKGSGWYQVEVQGLKGYMDSRYLVSTYAHAQQPAAQTAQPRLFNPNKGRIVNMRKGPGLNSDIIAAFPVGTAVTILEKNKDWYQVEILGVRGYVSAYFIK